VPIVPDRRTIAHVWGECALTADSAVPFRLVFQAVRQSPVAGFRKHVVTTVTGCLFGFTENVA
jgi:hypothetical protein